MNGEYQVYHQFDLFDTFNFVSGAFRYRKKKTANMHGQRQLTHYTGLSTKAARRACFGCRG